MDAEERLELIQTLVDEQAEDSFLWYQGNHQGSLTHKQSHIRYLQAALRQLHEVIEGKTGDECAIDIVIKSR